jgi:hypothetical protein
MNDDRGSDARVREELERMAGEMPAPVAPPPRTLRRARRRAALTAGASALVVVALSVGAIAGARSLLARDAGPAVSPTPSVTSEPTTTSVPTPAETDGGVSPSPAESSPVPDDLAAGPPPKLLLAMGGLYEFHDDGSIWWVGTLYGQELLVPPVQTPYGVVSLGGEGANWDLHIIEANDRATLLGEDVHGFAVSADGELLAFSRVEQLDSRTPPYFRTTLTLMSLSDGQVLATKSPVVNPESTDGPISDSARVEGFVGERILLTGGDGAAVFSALWNPESKDIDYLPSSYSGAYATAPETQRAVIAYGDGGCWRVITFTADDPHPYHEGDCDLIEASFSPDERIFAGATRDGRVVIHDSGGGTRQGEFAVPGAFQTVWEDDNNVLVVGRVHGDVRIWRCPMRGNCQLAFDAPPGYRWTESVYLVPRRPA